MRLLIGLRVDPAEGLEVVEVLVLGQHRGQVHGLVGAPLRGQHDATDLLHLETKSIRTVIFPIDDPTVSPGGCLPVRDRTGIQISGSASLRS